MRQRHREGRPKHYWSIYQNDRQGPRFDDIHDLFGVRILSRHADC
jgi:GTP pyrophosphokinase